jgi:hypothetical protein
MNLFVNAVCENGMLILFDSSRHITSKMSLNILWNESSQIINCIQKFLSESKVVYNDIENIVVVNGPWSFTGLRTIVLALNSLNYIIQKDMTSMSYFDLFESYPIIKNSSKRDLFVKALKNDIISIISNDTFLETFEWKKCYWSLWNNMLSQKVFPIEEINYEWVIKNIIFEKYSLISPLYIKKPNIS